MSLLFLLLLELVGLLSSHRTREVVALENSQRVKEMTARLKSRGPVEHLNGELEH